MKICVATAIYSRTGVPLAQIRLARALAKKGFDVDLMIGGIDKNDLACSIPSIPGVNLVFLDIRKARKMFIPICLYLKRTKPDIVFSAEDHLNGVFLAAAIVTGSKSKISGSSRVPPSSSYSNVPFTKGWFNKQLLRAVMWRADALTCVSMDMVDEYHEYFNNAPHIGIYNIIVDDESLHKMHEEVSDIWLDDRKTPLLISAGTLTVRKGFSDLIHAMSILTKKHAARLIILGEGPLKSELENLIIKLNLSDVVRLHGITNSPLKYYAQADVFVLASYAEGLPNVLVEAMMCGCTPVSTDCRTGPREVIQNDKYGYLVPVGNSQALADAIAKAIVNPISKEKLVEAIKPFAEDAVINKHFASLGLPNQPVNVNPSR